jgi:hypothetical protein
MSEGNTSAVGKVPEAGEIVVSCTMSIAPRDSRSFPGTGRGFVALPDNDQRAVKSVRAAFDDFYKSLSDERKAQVDRIGRQQTARRWS